MPQQDHNARTGSRFLYDSFDMTEIRLESIERLNKERFLTLERRLGVIEGILERLERRFWHMALAIVGLFAGQEIYDFLRGMGL